ncbi:MAG: diadenylate cyclase CdaA [Acidaminococcaceae bacterium]|uniref:diadenylate cyclase CdaA n=1 Tax=Succiniclasticum sp. TaxID=2775030 RepID=UPI001B0EDA03|nr:diadenylate cyclase CdaA [Succiniclasticum sp.]MBO5590703.1 diadenylate cyclase CdaA [Acidaminococcaceae bacterium]MBO5636027.1 diadenylate cyclase CdaA [Acidaminococcaceae bacterium]MBP3812829.1 diadenylate cyclase CdaA [Acidaminococcaceae bacterium]MBR1660762.1 diadenylate cyclase CdaA [Acidaminococcaceae bacterium]MDY6290861.1 diadenylate cyclase CdaA [Succiniclasticum sp.]
MLEQFQALGRTIGILDVIDTGLVAYFLYRIYITLKNTRAAALVKGLAVLASLVVISKWLNLHVVNWLLEKSMTMLMVALPVVFQPELRRTLEQIGRGRLFRKRIELDEAELNDMIEAVANAAMIMGQRKVGALIVFERAVGLEERIETGVKIDGLVTDSLLLNIFEKDTPLHDGAVIIRGNRIVAASCLLPLTDARGLSQELGTRHRAAIGISEQSDALVVVVSEETGTVSVTRNGEIYRYLRRDDVVDMLQSAIAQHHNITLKQFVREKIEEYRNGRNNAKEGKLPVKRGDRHDK